MDLAPHAKWCGRIDSRCEQRMGEVDTPVGGYDNNPGFLGGRQVSPGDKVDSRHRERCRQEQALPCAGWQPPDTRGRELPKISRNRQALAG